MKEEITQVCVVGGGISGVSAALSAAREGAKVTLLEREYLPGGLATLGLIAHYLPLCDGKGHQISFGIAEELMLLSASTDEQPDIKAKWLNSISAEQCPRYRYTFQPNLFALLLEKAMLDAGVNIRYGVMACGAETKDGSIISLSVQDKDELFKIYADAVVDATGDAAVCRLAGAATAICENGNALASWYYDTSRERLTLCPQGAFDDPDAAISEAKNTGRLFLGLDSKNITDFCVNSHRSILHSYIEKRRADPSVMLSTVPTIPQLRMVRRLCGSKVIKEAEDTYSCSDSIGLICDWRLRGPVYEIPYGCLYAEEVSNLFAAGRCVSADGAMWDQTRVIPACAVTGEAAGIAASKTLPGRRCSYEMVRTRLEARAIPLHRAQLF